MWLELPASDTMWLRGCENVAGFCPVLSLHGMAVGSFLRPCIRLSGSLIKYNLVLWFVTKTVTAFFEELITSWAYGLD